MRGEEMGVRSVARSPLPLAAMVVTVLRVAATRGTCALAERTGAAVTLAPAALLALIAWLDNIVGRSPSFTQAQTPFVCPSSAHRPSRRSLPAPFLPLPLTTKTTKSSRLYPIPEARRPRPVRRREGHFTEMSPKKLACQRLLTGRDKILSFEDQPTTAPKEPDAPLKCLARPRDCQARKQARPRRQICTALERAPRHGPSDSDSVRGIFNTSHARAQGK